MEIQLTPSQDNSLRRIISILNKEKIEYEIIGGLAAKFYGSSRDLNDIDINIAQDGFAKILPYISEYITNPLEYYEDEVGKQIEIALNYDGQEIEIGLQETTFIKDKITGDWGAFDDGGFAYVSMDYHGILVNVQTKDNLIKYKTACGRSQDVEDISQLY